MVENYNKILRNARIDQNLSINKVAHDLKIRADIVNTLEEGDFEHLPATGFTRNMVFSYARLLGLDAALLSRQYLSESNAFFARKKGFNKSNSNNFKSTKHSAISTDLPKHERKINKKQKIDSSNIVDDPTIARAASSSWTAPSFFEPSEFEPKHISTFGHVSLRRRSGYLSQPRYSSRSSHRDLYRFNNIDSHRSYSNKNQERVSVNRDIRHTPQLSEKETVLKNQRKARNFHRQHYSRFNNRASFNMRNEGYSGSNNPNFDARNSAVVNHQNSISSSKNQKNLGVIEKMNSFIPSFNFEKNKLTIGLFIAVIVLIFLVIINMTLCAPKIDVDKLSNVPISGLTDVEQKFNY